MQLIITYPLYIRIANNNDASRGVSRLKRVNLSKQTPQAKQNDIGLPHQKQAPEYQNFHRKVYLLIMESFAFLVISWHNTNITTLM